MAENDVNVDGKVQNQTIWSLIFRASTADVVFVLNAIIWHIWHTKNRVLSDVLNVSNFCNIEQYPYNFGTVRIPNDMVYYFFIRLSLSSHFFNWFFLSPYNLSLSPNRRSFLFRSDSQLLPQPQMSFSLFAPQIKPKKWSWLCCLPISISYKWKLQFPVQNKTQKWNHHKPNRSSSCQARATWPAAAV